MDDQSPVESVDPRTFSSKYAGESYQMKRNSNELPAGSTLIVRQPGTYGANASRGETTILPISAEAEEDGGELHTDRTQLLSEKIRKKKQGMHPPTCILCQQFSSA